MKRAVMVAALLGGASIAHADGEFAIDFVHWNNMPPANAEQTRVAKSYLAGLLQIKSEYAHAKVAQVICSELAQDLLSTYRFYYCQIGFEANAIDGGPFDGGGVMAWDGKVAAFHQENLDPKDAQGRVVGLRFFGAAQVTSMKAAFDTPKIVDDPNATRLTSTLNGALGKRIATPAVMKFFLMAHYETGHLVEKTKLPTSKEIEKELPGAKIDHAAYDRARKRPHQVFSFWRGLESAIVGVHFDATPTGFAMDEAVIAVHFTNPG